MTVQGDVTASGRVPLDLGTYDCAVVGGGVVGTMCAARLAGHGQRVIVIEPRSSLLWEVARARRWSLRLDDVAEYSPAAAAYFDDVAAVRGVRHDGIEPVAAQHTADRFLLDRGVRLLFQARALDTCRPGGVPGEQILRVALKGTTGELRAGSIVDCSDTAHVLRASGVPAERLAPGTACWALVFAGSTLHEGRTLTADVGGSRLAIRLAPTFRRGEVQADIAWSLEGSGASGGPPELSFGTQIVPIVTTLRDAVPELRGATMAYVCEEPWLDPDVIVRPAHRPRAAGANSRDRRLGELLLAHPSDASRTAALWMAELPVGDATDRLIGAGRWLEAYRNVSGTTASWEGIRTGTSNLFLLGEAVASAVLPLACG